MIRGKLLKLRASAYPEIKHELGDYESTFLLFVYENWYLDIPLTAAIN